MLVRRIEGNFHKILSQNYYTADIRETTGHRKLFHLDKFNFLCSNFRATPTHPHAIFLGKKETHKIQQFCNIKVIFTQKTIRESINIFQDNYRRHCITLNNKYSQ